MLGYRFALHQVGRADWPLRVESRVGTRPMRELYGESRLVQTFPDAYAPVCSDAYAIFEHLAFALKHEGIDLAALAAVFETVEASDIANWIARKPTGKYARKIGFLYEWLTGLEVPIDATHVAGPYEPVLDEAEYFSGPAINVARWRVRDNLPGTRFWCPTIHRTTLRGETVGAFDVRAQLAHVRSRVPAAVFERALAFAYLAETRATYAIEHEAPTPTQRQAFLRALQTAGDLPVSIRLSGSRLEQLQDLLFRGVPTFVVYGERGNDIFVGSGGPGGLRRIDYPCPPARAVESLLAGLRRAAAERLAPSTVPPVVFAAAVSFGFVFIHPLNDGNGRIHRFLIHEALVERNALERATLIPVSAAMLAHLPDYDAALRTYSATVRVAAQAIANVPHAIEATEPFAFQGYEQVQALYRYPILTDQVSYLERTIARCVSENLLAESQFLMRFDEARRRVSDQMNLPGNRLDLLITLILQNGGTLSKTKRQTTFPDLSDDAVAQAQQAIEVAFPNRRENVARAEAPSALLEHGLFDEQPGDDWEHWIGVQGRAAVDDEETPAPLKRRGESG